MHPDIRGNARETGQVTQTFRDELLDTFGGGDEARDTMRDLARHGADSGFPGITYYSDTVAMYDRHEEEIWRALTEDAEEFGFDNVPAFIGSFNGAAQADDETRFKNLLCWYMAERIAREFDD